MLNFCSNICIKKKLIIAFTIVITLTALMTIFAVSSQYNVGKVVNHLLNTELRKEKLALDSVASILRARNYEKEYLLHATTIGFEEARTTLAAEAANEISVITENLDEIIFLSPQDYDPQNETEAKTLASSYLEKFMTTVDLLEEKGFNDDGLEGEFRSKVHDIEDAIEAEGLDKLSVTMLMIRRHEKDYLMRGTQKYIDRVTNRVQQLISEVQLAPLSADHKQNIISLANEYQTLFNQVVSISIEIKNIEHSYLEDVSKLEPILKNIYEESMSIRTIAREGMESTASFSMITVIGLGLIVAISGILIAIKLAHYLTSSINQLAEVAKGIAVGDLQQDIDIHGTDEIGSMASAFRDMIKYTQDMAQAAQTLAKGDTRIQVTPKSPKDVLGNSFVQMISYQKQMSSIANRLAEGDIKMSGNEIYEHDILGNAFKKLNNSLVTVLSDDVQKIVDSAISGNLSQRIDLNGKHGFYLELSVAINKLVDVNDSIINDTIRVTSAMSAGNFDEAMNSNYSGSFAQLCTDVTSMQTKLQKVIQKDIEKIARAAAKGDLTQRISLADKEGFYKELASSINSIISQSEEIISDSSIVMSALAKGDLTHKIEKNYAGVFHQLKTDINKTIDQLTNTVLEIKDSAGKVRSGADEISLGNTSLSERTEQQAAALEETSATMDGINSTTVQTNKNAREADQLAKDASATAEKGRNIVANAVSAVRDIDNSSSEMASIISVIDEIAFQTNLLALNASVEAARAGEQGKGFAVVADEVRTLASRSAKAASEIKGLIDASIDKVAEGTKSVINSGEVLEEIVGSIAKVATIVAEISSASEEQTTGISEVSNAVSDMDSMTQQNSALVEESAAASETLGEQAHILDELINFFTTQNNHSSLVSFPTIKRRNPAA